MAERISIPFELQRRADLVRRYLFRINKSVYERLKRQTEALIQVRMLQLIAILRYILQEVLTRIDDHFARGLYGAEDEEQERMLRLDKDTTDVITQTERALRLIEQHLPELADFFGWEEAEKESVREYLKFLGKLREEGYLYS